MSRHIGVDQEGGYRAVTILEALDGSGPVTQYEGIYNQPGTAKGRISFWRGHVPNRFVDGWIERATTRWTRLGTPVTDLSSDEQLASLVRTTVLEGLVGSAERIRRELVCCDVYERVHGRHPGGDCAPACDDRFKLVRDSGEYERHSLCFWGEAAARLVETYELPTMRGANESG